MSLQWTLIATFLYVEIAVVLLLVLPVASPKRWQKIFKSRFLQSLSSQASIYFFVLLSILVLFFLDAIREMRKYSEKFGQEAESHQHQHLDAEMQVNMRLFRAQRNFYISGFALFLSLVIRRLVILISSQASLLAESEAAMQQAKSASSVAQSLLNASSGGQQRTGEAAQNDTNEAHDRQVTKLKDQVDQLKDQVQQLDKELAKEKKDKEAMKHQSESLIAEYDRLRQENLALTAESQDSKDNH